MPSPFPGMDPYLEAPAVWPDFHGRLIYVINEMILPDLPDDYDPRVETQVRLVEVPPKDADVTGWTTVGGRAVPDVAVIRAHGGGGNGAAEMEEEEEGGVATLAEPVETLEPVFVPSAVYEEVVRRRIEIVHRPDGELVTLIELLSLTNKRGAGQEEYLEKRRKLLRQGANLVEIDLLLGGRRLPLGTPLPAGDYFAFVTRRDSPVWTAVYAWPLKRRLPAIPIPLRLPDEDVPLDLAAALTTTYDRGRYGRQIRYGNPPPVELEGVLADWVSSTSKPTTATNQS